MPISLYLRRCLDEAEGHDAEIASAHIFVHSGKTVRSKYVFCIDQNGIV